MRLTLFMLICAGASFLASCDTNHAQRVMEPYCSYVTAELDYREQGKGGMRRLPPVIYRHGKQWYIAAVVADLRRSALADGELQRVSKPTWRYHKITPRLANHLLNPYGKGDISDEFLSRQLTRAGGEWLPVLPDGTKAVSAPYLMAENRTIAWAAEDKMLGKVPWYAYPDAAFSFAVFDLPGHVINTALSLAASPILIPVFGIALYQKCAEKRNTQRFRDEIRLAPRQS